MALPRKWSTIDTNLSWRDLYRVCIALESEPQKVLWLKHTMFAGNTIAFFEYKGRQFRMEENFELVERINEVTGTVEHVFV